MCHKINPTVSISFHKLVFTVKSIALHCVYPCDVLYAIHKAEETIIMQILAYMHPLIDTALD